MTGDMGKAIHTLGVPGHRTSVHDPDPRGGGGDPREDIPFQEVSNTGVLEDKV